VYKRQAWVSTAGAATAVRKKSFRVIAPRILPRLRASVPS